MESSVPRDRELLIPAGDSNGAESGEVLHHQPPPYRQHHAFLHPNSRSRRVRMNLYIIACILILVPVVYYSTLYVIDSFYFPRDRHSEEIQPPVKCQEACRFSLVETIPENLTFPAGAPSHLAIGDSLLRLIHNTKSTIDIASFYWTLRGVDLSYHDSSDQIGEDIFKGLMNAGLNEKIAVRIVQNKPSGKMPNKDTAILADAGAAVVRNLNMERLMGAGVLHTKLWLVDDKHFFVGSANLDWRAMTQVKELGVLVENCECLAADVKKLFEVYWYLAQEHSRIPNPWPANYSTHYNSKDPLVVPFNKTKAPVYLSSSPPPFCPDGRMKDDRAIEEVIYSADRFVYISVMDYFPRTIYQKHNKYWSYIDDALRRKAYDWSTNVRLMVGWWKHTIPDMPIFLKSLQDLSNVTKGKIEVKMFEVPIYTKSQAKIPFARVNHCKFMVTDKHAYIGTSNWSADYFINTGGVGFIVQQNKTNSSSPSDGDLRFQLEQVFLRDWNSQYAHPLSDYLNRTHGM